WDWEPGEEAESSEGGKPSRSPEGRDRRPRDRERSDSRRGGRSEERGPRRERKPEREGRLPRAEGRDRSESQPRRERRPERPAEETEQSSHSGQTRASHEEVRDDDFGEGLVEEARGVKPTPWREETPAVERRAESLADRGERSDFIEDDFAADLV